MFGHPWYRFNEKNLFLEKMGERIFRRWIEDICISFVALKLVWFKKDGISRDQSLEVTGINESTMTCYNLFCEKVNVYWIVIGLSRLFWPGPVAGPAGSLLYPSIPRLPSSFPSVSMRPFLFLSLKLNVYLRNLNGVALSPHLIT